MHTYDEVGVVFALWNAFATHSPPLLTHSHAAQSTKTGAQPFLRALVVPRLLQEHQNEGELVQDLRSDRNRTAPAAARNQIRRARPPLLRRAHDDRLPGAPQVQRGHALQEGGRPVGMQRERRSSSAPRGSRRECHGKAGIQPRARSPSANDVGRGSDGGDELLRGRSTLVECPGDDWKEVATRRFNGVKLKVMHGFCFWLLVLSVGLMFTYFFPSLCDHCAVEGYQLSDN